MCKLDTYKQYMTCLLAAFVAACAPVTKELITYT